MTIRYVLTDIEGTTTSITFVHDVLFPYSKKFLPAYVKARWHDADVQKYIAMVVGTCRTEGRHLETNDAGGVIATLATWIDEDRKHPGLKGLQGLVWEDGYRKGAFKAHVYEDVATNLRAWKAGGMRLAVYSSGSVLAQKLLFGHTTEGDLTPLFSRYFDTAVGGKKEIRSYQTIQKELNVLPQEILFLSDIEAELDAAKAAGFATTQLVRPGTHASLQHPTAKTFHDISLENGREAR